MIKILNSQFIKTGTKLIFFLLFSQIGTACDTANEVCRNAIEIDGSVLNKELICFSGCNVSQAPGYFDRESTACQGSPFGTAWYKINQNASNRVLNLECSSSELNAPVMVLYEGSCDQLITVDCNRSSGSSLQIKNLFLETGKTYWLAVSSADGSEGEFELCTTFSEDENVCNVYNSIEVKSTSKGSDFSGPFKPGEVVNFCYKIAGYQNVACNYLHGITPFFGEGWDPSSFNSTGEPITITQQLETQGKLSYNQSTNPVCNGDATGSWQWFESGPVRYNLNSDNPMSYTAGESIASGWVFVNSFNPDNTECFEFDDACCTNPSPDPNVGYGDDDFPICGRGMTQEWEVCFSLTTKSNPDCASELDCMLGFKSFSDGELGTIIEKSCKLDRVNYFNGASTCCIEPALNCPSKEITTCPNDPVTFQISSDDPEARFYWYDANEVLHTSTERGALELELSAATEGAHTYSVFATNGCTSESVDLILNIESAIAASITQEPAVVCMGEPVVLRAQLDDNSLLAETSFSWNDVNASTASEITTEGQMTYELEVSYRNCVSVLDYEVVTHQGSTLEMEGSAEICAGDRAFLKLALTGDGPWSVTLQTNTGELKELEIPEATYLEAIETQESMTYEILSATDAHGCTVDWQGEFEVEVTEELDISAGDDLYIYCDQSVELIGEMLSSVQDYSMQWIDEQGQILEPVEGGAYMVDDPGSYILEAVDEKSCVTRDTVSILDNPDDLEVYLPHGSDVTVVDGQSFLLEVESNLPSSEIASITWSGPEGFSCDDCQSAMITPTADQTYLVEITDIHGCAEQREIKVTVTGKTARFYIPTIFQPTSGGEDAKFTIFDNEAIIQISSMTIFDRWGNLVFESYNSLPGADSACWDGTKDGETLAQGVYVYQFVLELSDGETESIQGQLTLLR